MHLVSFHAMPPKSNSEKAMTNVNLKYIASATLLAICTASHAVPFEVQGSIRSITPLANGDVSLVCGKVTLVVRPTTRVTTPSRTISLAQLANAAPFPAAGVSPLTGLDRAGFVGGSCVAQGDDAVVVGQLVTSDLAVDVEESTLAGTTRAGLGVFNILGVAAVPITDARLSAVRPAAGLYSASGTHASAFVTESVGLSIGVLETARQQYGFGVNLATVPANDLSAADGYFGTDGKFYFHTLEVTSGALLNADPRPSIQRANCRNSPVAARDAIEVRGGCVMPVTAASAVVSVQGLLANGTFQTYGTATCTVDPLAAAANAPYRIGQYRFSNTALTLTNNVCPTSIRASTTQGGVTRYDFLTPDAR